MHVHHGQFMMHHAFRGLSTAIVFFLTGVASAAAQPQTADVIVYGATPGAFRRRSQRLVKERGWCFSSRPIMSVA